MKRKILVYTGIIFIISALYLPILPNYNFIYSIICFVIAVFCLGLSTKITNNFDSNTIKTDNNNVYYTRKNFLTASEYNFYLKMLSLQDLGYIIVPQVNLATIIEKHNSKYHADLFRNIDFGIFDKDFNLLLLIELNDSSHQKNDRRDRDLKVKKILSDCNIKLIIFYTYYPNEKDYVVKRILENIVSTNNKEEN